MLAAVLLYLSPVILVLALFEIALWRCGEALPMSEVVKRTGPDAHPDTRFERGLLDQGFQRFKYEHLMARKPKIIALGSSRVMQFCDFMFPGREGEFYNTGGMIQTATNISELLDLWPADWQPDVVILGVDLWWFNEPHQQVREKSVLLTKTLHIDGATNWTARLTAFSALARQTATHQRPDFSDMAGVLTATIDVEHPESAQHRIGLNALVRGKGFRPDGSRDYGLAYIADEATWLRYWDENEYFRNMARRGEVTFVPTDGIARPRMETFRRDVKRLKQRGTQVLLFAPAHSDELDTFMRESPGHCALRAEFLAGLERISAELDVPYIDASLTRTVGMDMRAMRDGVHAMETYHAKLLLQFLDDPRAANALRIDRAKLTALVNDPRTNPWYLAPRES